MRIFCELALNILFNSQQPELQFLLPYSLWRSSEICQIACFPKIKKEEEEEFLLSLQQQCCIHIWPVRETYFTPQCSCINRVSSALLSSYKPEQYVGLFPKSDRVSCGQENSQGIGWEGRKQVSNFKYGLLN